MILLLLATACLPPFPAGPAADGGVDSGVPSDGGTTDTDTDTDGSTDSGTGEDADGDGYAVPDDCDDSDADVNPGATEICDNGVDDNCDDSPAPCHFQGAYDTTDAMGTISGETTGGYVGSSMGVVVLDSGPAVAVGAGWDDEGAIWFFQDFGNSDGGSDTPTSRATLSLRGEAEGDQSGRAMHVADVDGDGHADLVVGGYATQLLGSIATLRTTGPIVHVIHGPIPSDASDLQDAADARLTGGTVAVTTYGHVEVDVGDVVGNRQRDVIIGFHTFADAAGQTPPVNRGGVVVLADQPVGDLDFESDAALRIEGDATGDGLGAGLATVDVDGDGIEEIVAGAHGAEGADTSSDGVVYIAGFAEYVDTGNTLVIGDVADVRIRASGATDRLGFTVADVGDVDGDGTRDVVIGADGSIYGQPDAGEVLVYFAGHLPSTGTLSAADADFRLQGQESGRSGGRLGYEIVAATDVDRDGHDDFYASGIWEEVDADPSGRVHLVPGGLTGIYSVDTPTDLLATWDGDIATDFGVSMIGNRDLSGDGVADLAVAGWAWGTGRGRVWAFESPAW